MGLSEVIAAKGLCASLYTDPQPLLPDAHGR
jgi:hypothetical protein